LNRISIKDIAREVGVSHQTVSRVINNHPDVAAVTRKRVLEVVRLRGYRPNALARGLVKQYSRILGVITNDLLKFGPASALAGMEEQANRLNYGLLIRLVPHGDEASAGKAVESLLSNQVDGIIWAGGAYGEQFDRFAEKSLNLDIPMVFTDVSDGLNVSFAAIDNRHGGKIATEHLLEQGYWHIGIITGDLNWWAARHRKKGWEDVLQKAGLPPRPMHIAEGDWSAESGERAFYQLIRQYPELDAVFASNDQIGLGVLKAAHDLNIRVPEQIGVIGFDDIPESGYFIPPLTTIHQFQDKVGHGAVEMLDQAIHAKRDEEGNGNMLDENPVERAQALEKQWFQPELVIRRSTLKTS